MQRTNLYKTLLLLACSFSYMQSVNSQISDIFNGVSFSNSLEEVQAKVEKNCESTAIIQVENPIFPLARESESHLICSDYSIYNGAFTFQKVAFTFSDGQLNYIEAKGPGVKRLADNAWYSGYKFYTGTDKMILNEEQEKLWFISKEGLHTNLFAWSNPYLEDHSQQAPDYSTSAKTPDYFRFGAAVSELQPILEKQASFIDVDEEDGGEVQINCFGIEYAGFPRKIEAKFNQEEGLYLLWILTGKEEEDRVRQAIQKEFGQPIYSNESMEVYNDWQVSLRKDKPEVLVLSKAWAQKHKARTLN